MIAALLPLLETLGAEGGAASAFGGGALRGAAMGPGSGVGATLGRLLGGGQIQPFSDQNELGGAMRQISDLTTRLSQFRDSMSQMREEHDRLGEKAQEDERLYGFRDPVEQQRMADLQQQQIEHARQVQAHRQQIESLQSRAAITMDPGLAAQQARSSLFRGAGALAVAGQAVQSFGPSVLAGLPGVDAASQATSFVGGVGGNIANQMGSQAAGAASNVAGGALKVASIGSLAGPVGAGVGAAVGGIAAAAGEIVSLPARIRDWSESLVESQRSISRFSPVLAQAFAQQERRGIVRGVESAQRTGGATSDLSSSLSDLADAIHPMRDAVTNVVARGLTTGVQVLTRGVKILEMLLEIAKKFDPTGTAKILELMEETSRVKAAIAMQPLARELRNLNKPSGGKPKDVPRR